MFLERQPTARPLRPRVHGHELVVAVELNDSLPGADLQLDADAPVGRRVVRFLEVQVAVRVYFGLRPGSQLRARVWQCLQRRLLPLGKDPQRDLLGRAMYPVAGLAQNPLEQLLVAVAKTAELAQRHERGLEVAHAPFHAALVARGPRLAGLDLEAVVTSELLVAPLHFRLAHASPRDGRLEVVNDDLAHDTAKELKGVAVAAQPRFHFLVPDQLGILVAAVAEGHHEDVGLRGLAGRWVRYQRA